MKPRIITIVFILLASCLFCSCYYLSAKERVITNKEPVAPLIMGSKKTRPPIKKSLITPPKNDKKPAAPPVLRSEVENKEPTLTTSASFTGNLSTQVPLRIKVVSLASPLDYNSLFKPTNFTVNQKKLQWPTVGFRITKQYSLGHRAIDIANIIGTPIYAADGGIIEKAEWCGKYGYLIIINHLNGMKTRYGHSSKLLVTAGRHVIRGQVIALMGSTGHSTGPHLHFEIYYEGRFTSPLTMFQ